MAMCNWVRPRIEIHVEASAVAVLCEMKRYWRAGLREP